MYCLCLILTSGPSAAHLRPISSAFTSSLCIVVFASFAYVCKSFQCFSLVSFTSVHSVHLCCICEGLSFFLILSCLFLLHVHFRRSSGCLLLDEFVAFAVAVHYDFSTFAGAGFACGSQQFFAGFPSNGPGFKDGGADG